MSPVRVALCGLGTVGAGTLEVLARNGSEIRRRAGRPIDIVAVASRTPRPERSGALPFSTDVLALAERPDIDVVLELIGGTGLARELVLRAVRAGKHVVTANKALIAQHGNELFAEARARGVVVAFEASVAGGIPIIKAIREGLAGNRIHALAGIINGTSNYILSQMREAGRSFAEALAEAQALGYAEADPTFDIEGTDAAHKLTILCSIAFGVPLNLAAVHVEGITTISADDVRYAESLGFRVKLLGITRSGPNGTELRVHPALVPADRLLANVRGVMNAVVVHADAVGETLYYGPGAGAGPTASAVVADLIDVVRTIRTDPDHRVPHLAFQADRLEHGPIVPIEDIVTRYYLRIPVLDRAGVLARIAAILSSAGISIEALIQRREDVRHDAEGAWVPIIILTDRVREGTMNAAIADIAALAEVRSEIARIRVEHLTAGE